MLNNAENNSCFEYTDAKKMKGARKMSWDYAELSKMASENGGPAKLVDTLVESGRLEGVKTGRKEMIPFILLAALGVWGYDKYKDWKNNKKKEDNQKAEDAKRELIDGINEYDANHIDTNGELENTFTASC